MCSYISNNENKVSITPKEALQAHFEPYQDFHKQREERTRTTPISNLALFRFSKAKFENPFLVSNQKGWVRKAQIFEDFLTDETADGWVDHPYLVEGVSPKFLPAELLF